jgi:PAS domain-containing protein
MTDSVGEIVLANRAAARLLGFKEDNTELKPVIEVVRDHEIDEILKQCLNTGKEQTIQFEIYIHQEIIKGNRRTCSEPWAFEWNTYPAAGPDGIKKLANDATGTGRQYLP